MTPLAAADDRHDPWWESLGYHGLLWPSREPARQGAHAARPAQVWLTRVRLKKRLQKADDRRRTTEDGRSMLRYPSSVVRLLSSGVAMTIMYHEGNRALQDAFDSRRISDRLE